ncbi:MAG: replication initiator, partial [Cutibacterium avidum]|nr:replication initiator [Cutibacterium avidum]
GIGAPAPTGLTAELLADAARTAAAAVSYVAPAPHPSIKPVLLVFGTQIDAKPVRTSHRPDDPDRELQPAQVAGYLAKYAAKDATAAKHGTTNPHLDHLAALCRTWCGHARARDNRRRAGDDVSGPVGKDGLDVYTHLGKWSHELGFRGHFSTKSRRYSITLGALRRARARFQKLMADQHNGRHIDWDSVDLLTDQDDDTTLILRDWAYDGTGWDTTTDEALALAAAARAREYDQWKAARKNTHPHPKEN